MRRRRQTPQAHACATGGGADEISYHRSNKIRGQPPGTKLCLFPQQLTGCRRRRKAQTAGRVARMPGMHVVFIGVLVLNIVVVVLLQRIRKRFPPALTAEQQNIVLGPFAFVVTLYAFLLSFVVINLWQTFSQAQRTVVIEAETA